MVTMSGLAIVKQDMFSMPLDRPLPIAKQSMVYFAG